MSRADDLAAKAARLRAQTQPQTPQAARTSAPDDLSRSVRPEFEAAPAPVRVRPVRLTVDVSPADHADLTRLALEAANRLGVVRVSGQEILRATLRRLLADQALQREILAEIAGQRRSR